MDKIKKLVKEKLCKKGEAYRKRRMAAGEKSSAYLSGRAVKVCKGQMSGKKKKKKKTNENEERYSGGAVAFNYKLKDLEWENIVYFFGDEQIGFPLPIDGFNTIQNKAQFENYKQGMLKRYPDLMISVLPQEKGRFEKIKIRDKDFNKDKDSFENSGATTISKNFSIILLARSILTFLFKKIIPPNALLGSPSYDLQKAFFILFDEATPHGLVCLIIIDVGSLNSLIHFNPLSISIILL